MACCCRVPAAPAPAASAAGGAASAATPLTAPAWPPRSTTRSDTAPPSTCPPPRRNNPGIPAGANFRFLFSAPPVQQPKRRGRQHGAKIEITALRGEARQDQDGLAFQQGADEHRQIAIVVDQCGEGFHAALSGHFRPLPSIGAAPKKKPRLPGAKKQLSLNETTNATSTTPTAPTKPPQLIAATGTER